MIHNVYEVPSKIWNMWTEEGRAAFNHVKLFTRLGRVDVVPPVAGWNAAFVAACETSGLNVEYPAKED